MSNSTGAALIAQLLNAPKKLRRSLLEELIEASLEDTNVSRKAPVEPSKTKKGQGSV